MRCMVEEPKEFFIFPWSTRFSLKILASGLLTLVRNGTLAPIKPWHQRLYRLSPNQVLECSRLYKGTSSQFCGNACGSFQCPVKQAVIRNLLFHTAPSISHMYNVQEANY